MVLETDCTVLLLMVLATGCTVLLFLVLETDCTVLLLMVLATGFTVVLLAELATGYTVVLLFVTGWLHTGIVNGACNSNNTLEISMQSIKKKIFLFLQK